MCGKNYSVLEVIGERSATGLHICRMKTRVWREAPLRRPRLGGKKSRRKISTSTLDRSRSKRGGPGVESRERREEINQPVDDAVSDDVEVHGDGSRKDRFA